MVHDMHSQLSSPSPLYRVNVPREDTEGVKACWKAIQRAWRQSKYKGGRNVLTPKADRVPLYSAHPSGSVGVGHGASIV